MNSNIEKLYAIAQKEIRLIIGLMSGTSMDGLDIALCSFSGSGTNTQLELLAFETAPFSEEIKSEIRKIFAKSEIKFQDLCLLNPWIGLLHGQLVLAFLNKYNIFPTQIDLIASHGQTVFHAPKILHKQTKFPNGTLQIGDADHLAVKTGIITLSDFRQKHCAAGGEGAPLAVYGDYLIFSKQGENRIMLNMGGIANFTYLPSSLNAEDVFSTDTGTGNTLIDTFARHFYNKPYDDGGKMAAKGKTHAELLRMLKKNDFFDAPFPKTTGPELFSVEYVKSAQKRCGASSIDPEDLMATLTRFSAETIAEAILKCGNANEQYHIYMSGGGMHNPVLVNHLKSLLTQNYLFFSTDDLGISGDAKEAVLFATLANEALSGGNVNFGTRKGTPSVSMGKISFPK
jgi:anhydro-N-acetylmuramic acid kinase